MKYQPIAILYDGYKNRVCHCGADLTKHSVYLPTTPGKSMVKCIRCKRDITKLFEARKSYEKIKPKKKI